MKKTNGQSGITLIALVVTIVVLLILAGITITFVLSDGGIFSQAQKAGTATNAGLISDYAGNGIGALLPYYYDDTIANKDYSAVFKAAFPAGTWETEPVIKVNETDVAGVEGAKSVTFSTVASQADTTATEVNYTYKGNKYSVKVDKSVVTVKWLEKVSE